MSTSPVVEDESFVSVLGAIFVFAVLDADVCDASVMVTVPTAAAPAPPRSDSELGELP
jgi:hypothetical protein